GVGSLHSFPTRRSSDLGAEGREGGTSQVQTAGASLAGNDSSPIASAIETTPCNLRSSCSFSPRCSGSPRESVGSTVINPYLHSRDRKSTRLNSSHDQIS